MDGQKPPQSSMAGFYLLLVLILGVGAWIALDPWGDEPSRELAGEQMAENDFGGPVTDQELARLVEDRQTVRAGARLFSIHCSKCHGSVGEGSIGPNLTDDFWIGGNAPVDIFRTIRDGRLSSGMPASGAQLGPEACKQVTAYVLAVQGRNLPGRPPQGRRAAAAGPGFRSTRDEMGRSREVWDGSSSGARLARRSLPSRR